MAIRIKRQATIFLQISKICELSTLLRSLIYTKPLLCKSDFIPRFYRLGSYIKNKSAPQKFWKSVILTFVKIPKKSDDDCAIKKEYVAPIFMKATRCFSCARIRPHSIKSVDSKLRELLWLRFQRGLVWAVPLLQMRREPERQP